MADETDETATEAEEAEDELESSDLDDENEVSSSDEGEHKKKKKKKKHHHDSDDEGSDDEGEHKKKKKKKKHHHDSDGKKRILIVEDERPLAHALELKLGHDGYETTTASNGIEGLEQAKSGGYDLMLLDLILPEMDGFTLLKKLKEEGSELPVVILSNLGQEEDKERVRDYGVAQYCVKSNMPLAAIVNTIKVLTT